VDALRGELAAREALSFVVDGAALRPLAAWPRDLVGRFERVVGAWRGSDETTRGRAPDADGPSTERDRILLCALLQDPADHDDMARRARDPGRRTSHLGLQALGLHGDSRGAALLRAALHAMDVDPGRGFAQRRLAALGLGRLGLREATPWLLAALAAEAHDHEGRPGAGLGVQFPVRAEILLALGELGDARTVPALVAHLADPVHHLAAMGALHALGPLAHAALDDAIARGPAPVAARARAVRDA
jgi:HEAT repeat protein